MAELGSPTSGPDECSTLTRQAGLRSTLEPGACWENGPLERWSYRWKTDERQN